MADIRGIVLLETARTTFSSLNGKRSSRLPPPRATIKTEYDNISNKFHVKHISQKLEKYHSDLDRLINRKEQALVRLLENFTVQLTNIDRLLEASSFQRTLDRGFVLVRDENDIPVFESSRLHNDQLIKLSFQDGSTKARVIKEVAEKRRRKQQSATQQESLF